ncbi:hypothetical protein BCR33DRAFT_555973 [Rhizoclosmatium globosum]|uniref:SET domain-containing protein n=1 Tax=Rhizoclosmatium globosum TaxID=329046 RepID=A0A1Y2CSP3_9FUNG|nr:hypothetical protein BCR33DRAFT_555973 [Rhizoclosmatium globosum]|eukprot:ORY49884.1 hypothetical protein BCR33DRAFT_555973 [Rhizoclosmatium globosum]
MTSDEESDTDGVRILLSSDDNSEPDDLSVVPLDPSVPPTFLQITNNPEILIQRHRDEPRMIGSDGMPRPWMSILARHYMWIRMNEWFEAKRLDRNIPLVKFTKDKTMEVTCAYVNPQNTNEIQILKGFSEIGKTFLKHVYGRKGRDPNLDEVRREPDKPYQPFQIFKIVSVQDVINDPRGVTKIVTADRDINAGEVIGMYDGKYLLQVEHHEIEETNVLNAFEREYKLHEFESTTNTSHHISTAILNHEKLNLSNIARERGQVKSLLLMDGAACRGMYGWASEINDYRKNPFGEDEPPNENCRILEVTVCGWPIFFLTITKPILKGQEVLLDYSSSYWPFIRKLYNDEQTVTALLDPLERCLPKLHASLPDMIQTYTPLLPPSHPATPSSIPTLNRETSTRQPSKKYKPFSTQSGTRIAA